MGISDAEIEHRKAFLELTADDEQRIAALNASAKEYAVPVIEAFYDHLLSFAETSRFFSDPAVLDRVKQLQVQYFRRLTQGDYGREYIADRLNVGAIHERVGVHIEHYLGAYSFYLCAVADQVFATEPAGQTSALDTFKSLIKLVFLDIELAVETYFKQRNDELQRTSDDLESLAHLIGHDLPQPIAAARTYAHLLAQRGEEMGDAAMGDLAASLEGALLRTNEMLSALLEYARLGTLSEPAVQVETGAIVAGILRDLGGEISRTGAKITVRDMPTILAPPTQLTHVLQNLLGNAIKFASATPEVEISAADDKSEWIFTVSDNGIGIDESMWDRMFEAFERGPGDAPGHGVGLAISRRAVERIGGRIWAEPRPEGGTRFHFTVPKSIRPR